MLWRTALHNPIAAASSAARRNDPDGVPPAGVPVPSDDDALHAFWSRAAASAGGLEVEVVPAARPASPYVPPSGTPSSLGCALFDRSLDTRWRRTPYTALTAAGHGGGPALGSEPEVVAKGDESDAVADVAQAAPAGRPSRRCGTSCQAGVVRDARP